MLSPSGIMPARQQRQYVTFSFMGDEYGVEISQVREIIESAPITLIPSMPPVVRGVINLRGAAVAVVDLALKFGQPATPLGVGSYIVLFDLLWHGEAVNLGVVTRDLGRVIEVFADEIKEVPDFGTRIRVDYLTGIVRSEERFVLLLDTERLLSPAELTGIAAGQREAVG